MVSYRLTTSCLLLSLLVAGCGPKHPTPEEAAQIEVLNGELAVAQAALGTLGSDLDGAGGLLGVLERVRAEVLRTNVALIQQRIHALESGAKITVSIAATEPDTALAATLATEIEAQEEAVHRAEAKAEGYGGLIQAMALVTVATEQQTLAQLRQRYLIAKYGLGLPDGAGAATDGPEVAAGAEPGPVGGGALPSAASTDSDLATEIIQVEILSKRFAEQKYQDYVWFDLRHAAVGLDKPARAIKGSLHFTDLFGETKLRIGWTIDNPIEPGGTVTERGVGFEYNQFTDSHQWAKSTARENMRAVFYVESILYQDGTRRDIGG